VAAFSKAPVGLSRQIETGPYLRFSATFTAKSETEERLAGPPDFR